jgi:oligopeptide/dipeptide ABC transporter ATP-binding protein
MNALLSLTDVRKYYPMRRGLVFSRRLGYVQAVDGISFTVPAHQTYGLVGESGCGKSTLAKCILLLEKLTGGHIALDGMDASCLRAQERWRYRRTVQGVFQDPFSSLNPRMRIKDILREPLRVHTKLSKKEQAERVKELLQAVELSLQVSDRFPHEFSGGQRQRVAVARALALQPALIVLDEPVSALDVSIRAQIMNLLRDLQEAHGVSYLLIAHDLAVVRYMSHRIGVMYLGKLVEEGSADEIATTPLHPYTKALVTAALPPREVREPVVLGGEVPSPLNPPRGCRLHPRCPFAMPLCSQQEPALVEGAPRRRVACFLYGGEAVERRRGV